MRREPIIQIDFEVIKLLTTKILITYAELLSLMKEHNGWLPLPEYVIDYFNEINVSHWSRLYFKDEFLKLIKDNEPQNADMLNFMENITHENLPSNPTAHDGTEFLNKFSNSLLGAENIGNLISELSWMDDEIQDIDASKLDEEDKDTHAEVWTHSCLILFNNISVATHGESLYSLIQRAEEELDDDAMLKAIQIERSLQSYFQDRINKHSMMGNSDFLDKLSYRISNPQARGENNHPLLWILFHNLKMFEGFTTKLTNIQILEIYNSAVQSFPDYYISDVQIVQRQRKKFNAM